MDDFFESDYSKFINVILCDENTQLSKIIESCEQNLNGHKEFLLFIVLPEYLNHEEKNHFISYIQDRIDPYKMMSENSQPGYFYILTTLTQNDFLTYDINNNSDVSDIVKGIFHEVIDKDIKSDDQYDISL